MSSDPFANTTTVKNILQHVLSPKIVSDGSGGYVTKTDLVNIDVANARNVVASNSVTTSNLFAGDVTATVGTFTTLAGYFNESQSGTRKSGAQVNVAGFTTNGIVLVQPRGTSVTVIGITKSSGSFTVSLSVSGTPGSPSTTEFYDYFIVKL
jgi:hypothetical protein